MKFELADRVITTPRKAFVVGIVNATPDSFYEKSRGGVDRALRLIADGADILDIGAESTPPGFQEVPAEEETRRLIPVIREIRRHSDIPISIDTRKLQVIKSCVDEGADILNDISALGKCGHGIASDDDFGICGRFMDDEKASFLALRNIPVILMHSFPFGRENRQIGCGDYDGKKIIESVSAFFSERISFAVSRGIKESKIIIDPGIGFGKTFDENMTLVKGCGKICGGKYPVMMACSRKRFIGQVIGDMDADRLEGTLNMNRIAVDSGATFIRVHDVREHSQGNL